MSRNMQLTVLVRPYYEKDMKATYPRLVHHLGYLEPDLAEQAPSLYELAGQVDQLLYRFDGTPFREVLLIHKDTLKKTYKTIQENIADWNLAAADKLLYLIEDIFDTIEAQLD